MEIFSSIYNYRGSTEKIPPSPSNEEKMKKENTDIKTARVCRNSVNYFF